MEENCRKEPMTSRHKHDIVSSLPLELVAQVAEYLDAVDIVRSQMVRTIITECCSCRCSRTEAYLTRV